MVGQMYLLLTRDQKPVAKGILESGCPGETMQIKITEGAPQDVEACQVLCILSSEPGEVPVMCQVTRRKENRMVFKTVMTLNPSLRSNYRIPADFDSFLYPVKGSAWKGRMKIKAMDMSCGGMAFYAADGLRIGDVAEIVIPNLAAPVLVKIKILREEALENGKTLYFSKFVDMCRQEEQYVCQAVFGIQIAHRKSGTETEYEI